MKYLIDEIMNYFTEALKKYAVFEGRARRKEFWIYRLVNELIIFTILLIGISLFATRYTYHYHNNNTYMLVWGIVFLGYLLFQFIPNMAVSVRRLHDTGNSGWYLLLNFLPFVGSTALFVFFLMDSSLCENQYGPCPKPKISCGHQNVNNEIDKKLSDQD